MSTARDMSDRVAIQHAVNRIVDDLEAEYGLLNDEDRYKRLLTATFDVVFGDRRESETITNALVGLSAQAQLWAEAIQTKARR